MSDTYNRVELNIPATVSSLPPIPGKPVVTIDGTPLDHIQALRVFADAKGNKPTLVTIEFYAEVTGKVEVKAMGGVK